jgi:NADPH-dependent 2,4-dienoyl-CoA reductase/sulfur reductase-like enzyme
MNIKRRDFLKNSAFLAAISPFYGLTNPGDAYSGKLSGLKEPSRTVPYVQQSDIIVCGGGPAGCAAAISAARLGARVQLIELQG